MLSWAPFLTFPAPAHILTGAWSTRPRSALPHVWWHLHADGAPTLLSDLAAQVFSLVPTSVSGECSFKQRSPVHTRIRNRLSDGKADMTQAIHFNKQQKKRFAEGALLHPRCSAVENQILYAIYSRQAQAASVTAATLQVAERQGSDCEDFESFAEPPTSDDQAILPDGEMEPVLSGTTDTLESIE
jgi:hypothetical protein